MPWSAVSDPSSRPKFLEAIEWFRKRVPMTDSQYARLVLLANGRAFTLAGVAQLDMVADVQRSIDRALSSGESFGDWKRKIKARLLNAWRRNDAEPANPGWRLETIFRTNVQRAYSAGRHEQLSDPVITQARPYRMYDAIVDDRTTDICQERNGTILPADDPWWDTNWPPLHFNAVTGGTLILTDRGRVRAEDVAPGDTAITHLGRHRTVTAVLKKYVRGATVRTLRLSSGRCLRVTNEHPILRSGLRGLEWKPAGDIQTGDHLFEHLHEVGRSPDVAICNPDNAPSLRNEPSVSDPIVVATCPAGVTFAVDFNGNLLTFEREVEDVSADSELLDDETGEEQTHVLLRWSEVLPESVGVRRSALLHYARLCGRVVTTHAGRVFGPFLAPSPMAIPASLCENLGVPSANRHLLFLRPDRDSVSLTSGGQHGLAKSSISLDGTEALVHVPVPGLNQKSNSRRVSRVDFHTSTVIEIEETSTYRGVLIDLSVDEDETFVADGVVVHNCRAGVRSLRESQAQRRGVTSAPHTDDAQEGFGLAPSSETFEPSPSNYPPDLWAAYQARRAAREVT